VTNGSDLKYNMLYSVYSYPNVILPLVGGVLIDKIGINFAIILFSTLLVIGQGIFALAGFIGESRDGNLAFIIAIIGRVVFGLGGESLNVCQSTIVSRWFIGKELSLALGINISVSRLGSVFNNYSMPPMADATSLGWALMFGFFLCILSWVSGFVLTRMENHANKVDNEDGGLKDDEKEEFHWRDITEFSLSFWLICANCVFTYIGLFCFNNVSNDFFVARYGMNQTTAARITSNVFLISAFLAPVFGIVCDKVGHKVTFCMVSAASLTLCHAMFIIIPASNKDNVSYWGVVPIVMLGITYSIYVAALWPMVPLVVKSQVVGSAYGLCTAVQNIGLAVGPTIVGAVTNKKGESDDRTGVNNDAFIVVNIVLGSFAFVGVLTSIGLLISDKVYYKGKLQKPSKSEQTEYVDILATPTAGREDRNLAAQDSDLKPYLKNQSLRSKVKRSIARSSMAK
jgi:MFS family permease